MYCSTLLNVPADKIVPIELPVLAIGWHITLCRIQVTLPYNLTYSHNEPHLTGHQSRPFLASTSSNLQTYHLHKLPIGPTSTYYQNRTNRFCCFPVIQIASFLSLFVLRLSMDFEFDNALFWGDENDGKTPVRITRLKSKVSVNTTLDAGNSAYSANDQDAQKSRPVTPISQFTNVTAPLQSSTSLYTSSEISGSKSYPASTVAKFSVSRTEPAFTLAPNLNTLENGSLNSGYGELDPHPSDGQNFKYGQPVLPSQNSQNFKYGRPILTPFGGQNYYRDEQQRLHNQDRGRRPYTNSTPSIPSSHPQSRPGRNSFHRGSNIEGEGGFRSAYITPNLYLSDPYTLGLGPDGYEGPDGFLRDNEADRAERAGFAPDGKSLCSSACSVYLYSGGLHNILYI